MGESRLGSLAAIAHFEADAKAVAAGDILEVCSERGGL